MEEIWQDIIKNIKKINNKKIRTKPQNKSFINSFSEVDEKNYTNIIYLHGYKVDEAYLLLKDFIVNACNYNKKQVIVITGKGVKEPSLKVEVRRWLQYTEIQKYILSFNSLPSNRGGEGALEVKLKISRA